MGSKWKPGQKARGWKPRRFKRKDGPKRSRGFSPDDLSRGRHDVMGETIPEEYEEGNQA